MKNLDKQIGDRFAKEISHTIEILGKKLDEEKIPHSQIFGGLMSALEGTLLNVLQTNSINQKMFESGINIVCEHLKDYVVFEKEWKKKNNKKEKKLN